MSCSPHATMLVELLFATPVSARLRSRLYSAEDSLHARHLIDLEVLQVLRRHFFSGVLSLQRAEALDAPLITCDRSLASSSGHRARIELL